MKFKLAKHNKLTKKINFMVIYTFYFQYPSYFLNIWDFFCTVQLKRLYDLQFPKPIFSCSLVLNSNIPIYFVFFLFIQRIFHHYPIKRSDSLYNSLHGTPGVSRGVFLIMYFRIAYLLHPILFVSKLKLKVEGDLMTPSPPHPFCLKSSMFHLG